MQTQARTYEGYFENGRFYPIGQMGIQGRCRVIVTVLDEPHRDEAQPNPTAWLDEFNRLLDESGDEKLSMENFPRANFTREHLEVKT
jgi:hypothetical protein